MGAALCSRATIHAMLGPFFACSAREAAPHPASVQLRTSTNVTPCAAMTAAANALSIVAHLARSSTVVAQSSMSRLHRLTYPATSRSSNAPRLEGVTPPPKEDVALHADPGRCDNHASLLGITPERPSTRSDNRSKRRCEGATSGFGSRRSRRRGVVR